MSVSRLTATGVQVLDAGGTPNARLSGIGVQVLVLDPDYIPISGTFSLSWEESNTNELGHRVYYSPEPMDPQALPVAAADLGPDVTTYDYVGEFIPDSTHYFRVSAYRGTGEDEIEMVSEELSLVATPS